MWPFRPAEPSFVCFHLRMVTIQWSFTAEKVPPVVHAMHGVSDGDLVEKVHRMVWHSDRFDRDDIDQVEILRGYRSHQVGKIQRAFAAVEDVHVFYSGGHLRVIGSTCFGEPAYFSGFAPRRLQAMAWVATGAPRLLVPWEGA
jgi:hypothetical protein